MMRYNLAPMPEEALTPDRIARQRTRLAEAKAYWATKPQAAWPSWVYDLMGVAVAAPVRKQPNGPDSKPYRLTWNDCCI